MSAILILKLKVTFLNNSFFNFNFIHLELFAFILTDKVKNPTIIPQKELFDNLNEWKFHFVISQVKNLVIFSSNYYIF